MSNSVRVAYLLKSRTADSCMVCFSMQTTMISSLQYAFRNITILTVLAARRLRLAEISSLAFEKTRSHGTDVATTQSDLRARGTSSRYTCTRALHHASGSSCHPIFGSSTNCHTKDIAEACGLRSSTAKERSNSPHNSSSTSSSSTTGVSAWLCSGVADTSEAACAADICQEIAFVTLSLTVE